MVSCDVNSMFQSSSCQTGWGVATDGTGVSISGPLSWKWFCDPPLCCIAARLCLPLALWAGSSPCSWLGEEHSVRGGGNAARAAVDGGQRPLTAVLEGWVVGALVATVVVVHLTLPLPPAVKDPDECLTTGNTSDGDKTSLWCSQQHKTRDVLWTVPLM